MSAPLLLNHVDETGVAHLQLNRVDKHNALNAQMIAELTSQLEELKSNQDVRVLWIRSNAKHFCAGADLASMQESANFSEQENIEDALALGKLMHTLYHFPKPTLASVHGACYGGGIGLAACCKIVVCTNTATFCFSEAKLGIIPAVISPFIIQAIGPRAAKAHFLTAEVFDGPKAYEMGLCYDVVSEEGLEERSQTIVQHLLKNGPKALEGMDMLIEHQTAQTIDDALLEKTAQWIAQFRTSEEGQEGLKAFLEKRTPNWVKNI